MRNYRSFSSDLEVQERLVAEDNNRYFDCNPRRSWVFVIGLLSSVVIGASMLSTRPQNKPLLYTQYRNNPHPNLHPNPSNDEKATTISPADDGIEWYSIQIDNCSSSIINDARFSFNLSTVDSTTWLFLHCAWELGLIEIQRVSAISESFVAVASCLKNSTLESAPIFTVVNCSDTS